PQSAQETARLPFYTHHRHRPLFHHVQSTYPNYYHRQAPPRLPRTSGGARGEPEAAVRGRALLSRRRRVHSGVSGNRERRGGPAVQWCRVREPEETSCSRRRRGDIRRRRAEDESGERHRHDEVGSSPDGYHGEVGSAARWP
ncbi:hypothetical protein GLOTRDRAFT_113728, partial [Gloeophyllum trabeum ATCC 11539]